MTTRSFYGAIGVTPHPAGDEPVWSFSLAARDYPDYPGYLKFQTAMEAPTLAADVAQANEFEAWLKARGFKYTRGYPDDLDLDQSDRRFCLDREATIALAELAILHDLEEF